MNKLYICHRKQKVRALNRFLMKQNRWNENWGFGNERLDGRQLTGLW